MSVTDGQELLLLKLLYLALSAVEAGAGVGDLLLIFFQMMFGGVIEGPLFRLCFKRARFAAESFGSKTTVLGPTDSLGPCEEFLAVEVWLDVLWSVAESFGGKATCLGESPDLQPFGDLPLPIVYFRSVLSQRNNPEKGWPENNVWTRCGRTLRESACRFHYSAMIWRGEGRIPAGSVAWGVLPVARWYTDSIHCEYASRR